MDINEWDLRFRGAESRIWFGRYANVNAVKKERFIKKYRITEMDSRLTRERIRAELKAIMKIKEKSNRLGRKMPTVLYVDNRNIIMTQIENAKTVCKFITENIGNDRVNMNEVLSNIGKVIAQIHNCGVIHGDLTSSNFIIKDDDHCGDSIIPIDFGLSSFSMTCEDRAVDLYVLERALLSTYVHTNFNAVLDSYAEDMGKVATDILKKLSDVRMRGRKRLAIG